MYKGRRGNLGDWNDRRIIFDFPAPVEQIEPHKTRRSGRTVASAAPHSPRGLKTGFTGFYSLSLDSPLLLICYYEQ